MGAEYLKVRSTWPTYANGKPADEEAFAVIDERIDALDREACAEIVDYYTTGLSLAEYGEEFLDEDTVPDGVSKADREKLAEQAGIHQLRVDIKKALRHCAESGYIHLDSDGLRWWAETGGLSWGDAPTESYDRLRLLAISEVADEPIGGTEFMDAPAHAAAIAVLDDLADTALKALRDAGVAGQQYQVAEEALRTARLKVTPAAKMLRRALEAAASG